MVCFCQCLLNYNGTSAFADVNSLTANVEAKFFCIEMYWTPAKMPLLADVQVNEYSFANAVKFVNICVKNDRVIMAPHCIYKFFLSASIVDIAWTNICISNLCDADRAKCSATKMPDIYISLQNCPIIKQVLFFSKLDFMVNWRQNHQKPVFIPM